MVNPRKCDDLDGVAVSIAGLCFPFQRTVRLRDALQTRTFDQPGFRLIHNVVAPGLTDLLGLETSTANFAYVSK